MARKIIPKGVKQVRKRLANGTLKTYWYHRATGKPIKAEPNTAEALLEIQRYDRSAAQVASAAVEAAAQSFAALWTAYHSSPEFIRLKHLTKKDYERVRDWLGPAAEAARPAAMTSEQVLKLRDKAFKAHGRRFANYVVQVMRLVLEWGRPRGWLRGNPEGNPARGVKLIKKPRGEPNRNRAWTDAEVRAFLDQAPSHLKVAFALGLFAGMREGDVIRLTWKSYDGVALRWIAGKNDEPCLAPVTGVLKALLDEAPKPAVQICVSSRGQPWRDENSFRSAFFKTVRDLQGRGLLGTGATFHGLRHTVGSNAREGGESEFRVAAALGDRSTAMAEIYGRDASRQAAQTAVLGDLQKRFENGGLETKMETKPLSSTSETLTD